MNEIIHKHDIYVATLGSEWGPLRGSCTCPALEVGEGEGEGRRPGTCHSQGCMGEAFSSQGEFVTQFKSYHFLQTYNMQNTVILGTGFSHHLELRTIP